MEQWEINLSSPWKETRIGIIPRTCYVSNKTIWPFSKAYTRSKCYAYELGLKYQTQWALKEELTIAMLKYPKGI